MKVKRILILVSLGFLLGFPAISTTQTRDTGKIYKVAILPFLIHSQENIDYVREGIYDMLSSRITTEGRIEIIERTAVEQALYQERPMRLDESAAMKIGMRVGADYIILGSLTKIGNYISLDAQLISITEDKPSLGVYTQHKGLDDVMVKIGDFAQDIGYKILGRRAMAGRRPEPKGPFVSQPRAEIGRIGSDGSAFKKSQTFNFEIKGLDIGDVDGDKKNEVVIMDKNSLYIFKYDGDKLNLFRKVEQGFEHNFLTLDVVDLNRNGYAEIIVTSVVEDNLRSFILEYEEGKFKKVTEKAGWYFRVLHHPKEGPTLMGQQRGSEGVYVGPIYKFVWKKNSFEKGPKMPFPKGTKIFGLTVADIRGNGTPEILLIDGEPGPLRIVSQDGKELGKSSGYYGGTSNYYETLKKKGETLETFYPLENRTWRVYIPPRILIKDLNGDGLNEVIINKNNVSGVVERLRTIESGEIDCLAWEQNNFVPQWKTQEFKGNISDYQLKDVDNDGEEELVAAVITYGGTVFNPKGTSNILFFKLF
jgi:TolB-like protein